MTFGEAEKKLKLCGSILPLVCAVHIIDALWFLGSSNQHPMLVKAHINVPIFLLRNFPFTFLLPILSAVLLPFFVYHQKRITPLLWVPSFLFILLNLIALFEPARLATDFKVPEGSLPLHPWDVMNWGYSGFLMTPESTGAGLLTILHQMFLFASIVFFIYLLVLYRTYRECERMIEAQVETEIDLDGVLDEYNRLRTAGESGQSQKP